MSHIIQTFNISQEFLKFHIIMTVIEFIKKNALFEMIVSIIKNRVNVLLLSIAKSAHFQLHHGENKLHSMMMMSDLNQTNTLTWTLTMVAHCNNSPQVYISLPTNTLSLFCTNQFLLQPVMLPSEGTTRINVIVYGLTRSCLKPTIYHTRG